MPFRVRPFPYGPGVSTWRHITFRTHHDWFPMAPGTELSHRDCRVVWSGDSPSLDAVRRVVHSGFELRDPSSPRPIKGPAGYRRYVETVRSALPDVEARVETAVEGQGWVRYRRVLTGTHRRQFMCVPSSGEVVTVRLATLARTGDDRIAEAWTPGWTAVARDLAEAAGVDPPPAARDRPAVEWEDLPPGDGPFE